VPPRRLRAPGPLEQRDVLRALGEGKWEIVVLQEQSTIPSFERERRAPMMDAYAHRLHEEIARSGARTLLYMTWGYRDGDRQNRPGDTNAAMQDRLESSRRREPSQVRSKSRARSRIDQAKILFTALDRPDVGAMEQARLFRLRGEAKVRTEKVLKPDEYKSTRKYVLRLLWHLLGAG
jgi:hypothetical protein